MSADLITGRIIADLPSFDPSWPLQRTISKSDSATGTLHLAGAPENWQAAIYDGGTILACYDDTDPSHPILWAGYVLAAGPFAVESDDVPVSLATFEALFDRAFVGDVTYTTSQHRDDIIADLINSWFIPKTGITSLQLSYTAGGGPTPVLMDNPPTANAALAWLNTDNATVQTRLNQVIGQLAGEYTVNWSWSTDGESIIPTLVFGDRIGQPVTAGLDPAVTFEAPGVLTSFQQMRDYSPGNGANLVYAYGNGQGTTSPYSTPVTGPVDGRPTFEYRYQPVQNTSTVATLTQYAQQAITVLAPGARPITMTAALNRMTGRRLGVDWNIGDDLGYRVASPYTNEQGASMIVPAFPNGIEGIGRAVGYQLTYTTLSPILADAAVYVQQTN